MRTNFKLLALFLVTFTAAVSPCYAEPLSSPVSDAVKSLPTVPAPTPEVQTLTVDSNKLPNNSPNKTKVGSDGKASVPFAVQNSMIIQFQPNATAAQVSDYISSNRLEVVKKFPSIGAVQVKTDLTKFFKQGPTGSTSNDEVVEGLIAASKEFKKDPRVLEATPDLVLSGQSVSVSNFETATNVSNSVPSKITDWGAIDIQADQLWNKEGAEDGALFGIMDAGFSRHEGLVFLDYAPDMPVEDHGTHVAGVACGNHNTPKGVRGVIPNCLIRAHYANIFFQSTEGSPETRLLTVFSQILGSLTTFLDSYNDVYTFNVSMGYNWKLNLGINPDEAAASNYRALIGTQAPILVSVLKEAESKGKIIFSPSGNDSEDGSTPVGAKYASPLNWAAITAREQGIKNGIIVEAHDQSGHRASFSNVGGDISCPGVNVTSSVSYDSHHNQSKAAYGQMSGTSVASPYCAAGLVLFRLVRPKYTAADAMNCLITSGVSSSSGTPMLKLAKALDKCP